MAYNYQSPFFNTNPMMPNAYMPQYGGNMPSYMPQSANVPQAAQNPSTGANQPEQLINGGLIVVPTEEDVKKYPVAPGNFVTFKIENQPVIIEKSMSRSQFDSPHYERYKLIKEEVEDIKPEIAEKPQNDGLNGEIEQLKKEISRLDVQIDVLKDNYTELKKSIKPKSKRAKLNIEEEESDDE